MGPQQEALLRLLTDDDPETVRLVKEQLVNGGQNNIPDLEQLIAMDNKEVSLMAQDLLTQIERNSADAGFTQICSTFGEYGNLEEAMWGIARARNPGFNLENYENRLQMWARQLRRRISGTFSSRERILELSAYISGELGFRGNTDNYYSEKNSLMPNVLDTRLGIPITLTIVYMMLAKRADIVIEGINLPGHFIARHEDVLFDPFHKGRILTQGDCREILSKQNLPFDTRHLLPATPRQILVRVLVNLLYVYDLEEKEELHTQTDRWVKALTRQSSYQK
jgi:regulator of sirC expression with transglutaminase-like and TPR domain